MGWTGEYSQARTIKEFIDNTLINTINYAPNTEVKYYHIVHNTIYCAVKTQDIVEALIILISKKNTEFIYKIMGENSYPFFFDANKKLIKMLTATENTYANDWRKECMKKYKRI